VHALLDPRARFAATAFPAVSAGIASPTLSVKGSSDRHDGSSPRGPAASRGCTSAPLLLVGKKARVSHFPLGVVGIIGP